MIAKNVEKYCRNYTLIENYGKAMRDRNNMWIVHHRFEIDKNMSREELLEQGLYYNRPAEELIFVTRADHARLHFTREQTELHKKRRAEKLKGRKLSEKTKRKMSLSHRKRHFWVLRNFRGDIIDMLYAVNQPAEKYEKYVPSPYDNPLHRKPGESSAERPAERIDFAEYLFKQAINDDSLWT